MTFRRVVLSCVVLWSSISSNVHAAGKTNCFPPNKLHLKPSPLEKSNISQNKFNEIIAQAEKIYAPVVKAHKAKLKIHRRWKDETVNATASQTDDLWEVDMFGGLARRPEVTPDGFALVLCHELGHHLGGYVMASDSDMDWASNEGQSDYFATEACAKEIWKNDLEENAKHRALVLPFAKSLCDKNYQQQSERDLCYRSSNAGLSLASLLATLRNSELPKFETPSKDVVQKTIDEHPEAQCRLDTYMAGAVCTVPFERSIIPGKGLAQGGASLEAEMFAGQSSCMARDGWVSAQRPRCWFKPYFEFDGLLAAKAQWSDHSRNGRAEPGETLSVRVPIENQWNKLSQGVVGEIFSLTQGVKVVQGKSNYPDIAPGTTSVQATPFEIKVAKNFSCGRPFELLFRASAAAGSREFPLKWFVGPKQSEDFILERRTELLPIEDYPSPGLSLAFEVSENLTSPELELFLTLNGIYPEEIAVSLKSPDGRVHELKTEGGFDSDNQARVKIAFEKPLQLRGRWLLNLKDTQENDTATLKSFELRAPFAEKVDCGK
jgi:hypothetical protein